MRFYLAGSLLMLAACGVEPPTNNDGAPVDSSQPPGNDGMTPFDSTTNPLDVASFDSASTMDTGVATPMDSGAPFDSRVTDARSDTGTIDSRPADVSSMPDTPSPRDVPSATDVLSPMDVMSRPDATSGGGVIDYTARGYYRSMRFTSGLPSGGFVRLPPGMTYSQLVQLQQDCVDRINQYRAGTLRFTNGTADPGVPRTPLNHLMGNNACSSAQALGDLANNGGAGGCAGAHSNSFNCPWTGSVGQNTCCLRTGATYAQIRTQLFACLQSMWDEGTGMPSNATFTTANGHWFNMRSSAFTQVSCGFAFNDRGHVWMNQDFSAGRPASVPQTCACTSVGASDGCGATCVAGP